MKFKLFLLILFVSFASGLATYGFVEWYFANKTGQTFYDVFTIKDYCEWKFSEDCQMVWLPEHSMLRPEVDLPKSRSL